MKDLSDSSSHEINEPAMRSYLSLLIIILTASGMSLHKGRKTPAPLGTPPGVVAIDSNFYVDLTETTNFNWMEYMYWTKKVFGEQSAEYKATILDSMIWEKEACLSNHERLYFGHPVYRHYPVTCVSQQQAEAYCKWRSDRVFEYYLVREKIIAFQMEQTPENHFTIEHYFEGRFNNTAPHPGIKSYPVYRLPTADEWKKAVQFSDSAYLQASESKRFMKKHGLANANRALIGIAICDGPYFSQEPTQETEFNGLIPTDLYGNVSEWLSVPNTVIGGSWKEKSREECTQPKIVKGAADHVGFRCVCEMKDYKIGQTF